MVTWIGLSHIVAAQNGALYNRALCGEEREFKREAPGNPVCPDCVQVALSMLTSAKTSAYERLNHKPAPHYEYVWSD